MSLLPSNMFQEIAKILRLVVLATLTATNDKITWFSDKIRWRIRDAPVLLPSCWPRSRQLLSHLSAAHSFSCLCPRHPSRLHLWHHHHLHPYHYPIKMEERHVCVCVLRESMSRRIIPFFIFSLNRDNAWLHNTTLNATVYKTTLSLIL